MKTKRNKCLSLIAVALLTLSINSCGMAENKAKKLREQEMFMEYPTLPGDIMWDISIITRRERLDTICPVERDTAIIVKNGDEYWRVKKDGSRQCVKYFKYRR